LLSGAELPQKKGYAACLSQDNKVIAIQYSMIAILVGIVSLGLSGLMLFSAWLPLAFRRFGMSVYFYSVLSLVMLLNIHN